MVRLLIFIITIIFFNHNSFASIITAYSEVISTQNFSVNKERDIIFGDFSMVEPGIGGTITLDKETAIPSANIILLNKKFSHEGHIKISGPANAAYSYNFPTAPVKLIRTSGKGEFPFTLTHREIKKTTDATKSETDLFLGGELTIPANSRAGTYKAEFNITVDYKN